MNGLNGTVFALFIIIIGILLYTLISHQAKEYTMKTVNRPAYDTLMFRAEAYGRYYAAHHPNRDEPLSGEYADDLTLRGLFANLGTNIDEVDPLDIDTICDSFESAYTEQDTDSTGWKFPRCTCTSWTHDLDALEIIARDSNCPAHDGDAWNDYANNHKNRKDS